MHSKLGIFSVFLFATVLLIPASSFHFVNAQEYNDDTYYYQDFNKKDNYSFDNNGPDNIDKDSRQYYNHYSEKENKNFEELVQKCEECFLQELYYQLSDKQRYFFFDAIEYEFGSLEKLCKLIVSGKISEQELEDILRHILVQVFDKVGYENNDKINSYSYNEYEDKYSKVYYDDENSYKSIPSQKIDKILDNIIECLFSNPTIYVVWRDNTLENSDIFFSASTDNGQTFSEPDNISDNEGDSNDPQIATEGDNVYVVWVDRISVKTDILFSFSTNNGKSFSPPDTISDNQGESLSPQIAAKGYSVFVVWSGSTPVTTDILFSFSTNNGKSFSTPDNISDSALASIFPQITIKGYNVYLVWEDRIAGNNDIFISFSNNNGVSFSQPDNISDNIGVSGRPQIAAEGDNVYSVWEDNTPSNPGILFSFSTENGESFSQPNDISDNIGPSLNPQMAVKGDNVYVVWRDMVQGNNDIFISFSTNNGVSFSQPDNISNSTGNSNSPKISAW
ncbi:MAG: sialidase family protein [Nitrososphaeraceae archaeon]